MITSSRGHQPQTGRFGPKGETLSMKDGPFFTARPGRVACFPISWDFRFFRARWSPPLMLAKPTRLTVNVSSMKIDEGWSSATYLSGTTRLQKARHYRTEDS